MFDLVLLLEAVIVGALVAAAVMIPFARPPDWRRRAAWSWSIGAGIVVACALVDQWPHWPPLEDRGRFLTLVVPLTVVIETLAAARSARVAWIARALLAASVLPILLHDSVYLADHDRRSAEWSMIQAAMVSAGSAATLIALWMSAGALARRTSTRHVCALLALDALATALVVMLCGYYRAGLVGLSLAGAIGGAALAFARPRASTDGSLGISVAGIFSVMLMGRFFGSLPSGLAIGLLLAPLAAWIVELPRMRRVGLQGRLVARAICVALPLIVIVVIAWQRFHAASTR